MERRQIVRDEDGRLSGMLTSSVPSFIDAETGEEGSADGFGFWVEIGGKAIHSRAFLDPVKADTAARLLRMGGLKCEVVGRPHAPPDAIATEVATPASEAPASQARQIGFRTGAGPRLDA